MNTQTQRRIMRLPEVMALTGFGRAWIYELARTGQFPKQVKIGKRATGWDSQEVDAWIAAKFEPQAIKKA